MANIYNNSIAVVGGGGGQQLYKHEVCVYKKSKNGAEGIGFKAIFITDNDTKITFSNLWKYLQANNHISYTTGYPCESIYAAYTLSSGDICFIPVTGTGRIFFQNNTIKVGRYYSAITLVKDENGNVTGLTNSGQELATSEPYSTSLSSVYEIDVVSPLPQSFN